MSTPTTSSLEEQIASLNVAKGTVSVVWLGQGGYLFKSPGGLTIMLDPYLSDFAEPAWGVQRLIPPVIDPACFTPDVLLITHWHEDHLDMPTVRHYAQQPHVIFAGPASCVLRAQIWGWPVERTVILEQGDTHTFGDVTITATFARHEVPAAMTPDAVGYLLETSGLRLWNVADTEYDARLRGMGDREIDVAFVPINGVGGNLNAHEAALLMWHVAPRVAIPMHYGMWTPEQYGPGATLDPELLRETLTRLGGSSEVQVLREGEIVTFESWDNV
ncbi:MAG TPA: MBL fold metallo-hydrolase [Armatimonadota bacterium]|nr:MBL fold metallo-hydrolase [Armatimonadota bacterium]